MNTTLRCALFALASRCKGSAEEMEKIIIGFGLFASMASAAAGSITGVGPIAATAITTACVYAMYYKLAQMLEIKISKNILKSVASAVLANVVSNVGVTIAAAIAVSFIPAFGNLSSATICAVVQFASVYVSGYIFVTTLDALYDKFGDLGNITNDTLKKEADNVTKATNTKDIIKEAKQVHKDVKNDKSYKDLSDIEKLVNEAKNEG